MLVHRYFIIAFLISMFILITATPLRAQSCKAIAKNYASFSSEINISELIRLGECINNDRNQFSEQTVSSEDLAKIECTDIAERYSTDPGSVKSLEAKKLLQCIADNLKQKVKQAEEATKSVPNWRKSKE